MTTKTEETDDMDTHLANVMAGFKPRPQAEVDAMLKAAEEKSARLAKWKMWATRNLPPINAVRTPDLSGPFGEKLSMLRGKIGKGATISIIGKCGLGKTQLGVELLRDNPGYYTTGLKVGMALRDFSTAEERMEKLCSYKLLVIDEAFKRQESDWMTDQFFGLINQRHSECRDTVLIDNLTLEELGAKCGEAIIDRMQQIGGVVVCNWKNYRENYTLPENMAEELAGYNEARRMMK